MKLLLTSAGITNDDIRKALEGILDKPLTEAVVFFVPTAINQFNDKNQKQADYKKQLSGLVRKIYTIDVSNEPKDKWSKKLGKSDLIYVSGGNPYYLLYWVRKSGLAEILPDVIKTKAYLGISAGSMIMGNQIPIEPKDFSLKYIDKKNPHKALGIVGFNIEPHFGAEEHPDLSETNFRKLAKTYPAIYAIGDQSALLIVDDTISMVNKNGIRYYE